jgi:hypothetical protein
MSYSEKEISLQEENTALQEAIAGFLRGIYEHLDGNDLTHCTGWGYEDCEGIATRKLRSLTEPWLPGGFVEENFCDSCAREREGKDWALVTVFPIAEPLRKLRALHRPHLLRSLREGVRR